MRPAQGASTLLAREALVMPLPLPFCLPDSCRSSPAASGLGRVKTSANRKSPLTTCDFQACRFDVFDFSASESKVSYLRKISCAFSHGLDPPVARVRTWTGHYLFRSL